MITRIKADDIKQFTNISRIFAMPNKDTFSIPEVKAFIDSWLEKIQPQYMIDPFVRNSPYKDQCKLTNDLNPDIKATTNQDALEFLKDIKSHVADFMFFDPPWTLRQISESYKNVGIEAHMEDTQSSFYTVRKREAARVTKIGGYCVSCGYTSSGMGKDNGFELEEILIINHGGAHYDSIITIDQKIRLGDSEDGGLFNEN